ncbi:MAG TPA: hypothetical protein VGI20_12815 [Rhizomicrobium sp.]|jgi:hypothetical protein
MAREGSERSRTEPAPRHWAIPHVAAVALTILAYLAIYSVTGDSDLFLAIATGAAGGAMTWLGLKIELWLRGRQTP